VLTALHDNAPVMLLLGVGVLIWGRRVLYALAGRTVDQPRTNRRTILAFAAFFSVFAIYRNTGYGAWLAPLS
jgi:di/tricarboxylate transporter